MASKASLINCRLRRLRGVSIRNITIDGDTEMPFAIFFALSMPDCDGFGYFHRSHEEWNCLHPNWRYIDLSACSHKQQSTKDFVISLFIRVGNDDMPGPCRLLREWRIHVSGLLCVGSEMPPSNALGENEDLLVLQFGELFYTTYKTEEVPHVMPGPQGEAEEELFDISFDCKAPDDNKLFDFSLLVRSDESYVRKSYSLSTLHRLLRLAEERMRTTEHLRQQEENCLTAFADTQPSRDHRLGVEERRMRLRTMRYQVNRMREKVAAQAARLKELRTSNETREKRKQEITERTDLKNSHLKVAINVYKRLRSDLNEYRIQIVSRRLELARSLPHIFPIGRTDPEAAATPTSLLSICHLPLPTSNEDQASSSFPDSHLSAAYSFAAQLLRLMSLVADVPLRYPLQVIRSRLHIRDNIVCQLEDNERSFQLHVRNRSKSERIRFKYAVFLLNRNICLMRLNCGFDYKNLPATLFNLLELMHSPLTPICSADVQRAAEQLNQEMRAGTVTPRRCPEPPQPQASQGGEKTWRPSLPNHNQTQVQDIFFHGDAMDLAV